MEGKVWQQKPKHLWRLPWWTLPSWVHFVAGWQNSTGALVILIQFYYDDVPASIESHSDPISSKVYFKILSYVTFYSSHLLMSGIILSYLTQERFYFCASFLVKPFIKQIPVNLSQIKIFLESGTSKLFIAWVNLRSFVHVLYSYQLRTKVVAFYALVLHKNTKRHVFMHCLDSTGVLPAWSSEHKKEYDEALGICVATHRWIEDAGGTRLKALDFTLCQNAVQNLAGRQNRGRVGPKGGDTLVLFCSTVLSWVAFK